MTTISPKTRSIHDHLPSSFLLPPAERTSNHFRTQTGRKSYDMMINDDEHTFTTTRRQLNGTLKPPPPPPPPPPPSRLYNVNSVHHERSSLPLATSPLLPLYHQPDMFRFILQFFYPIISYSFLGLLGLQKHLLYNSIPTPCIFSPPSTTLAAHWTVRNQVLTDRQALGTQGWEDVVGNIIFGPRWLFL